MAQLLTRARCHVYLLPKALNWCRSGVLLKPKRESFAAATSRFLPCVNAASGVVVPAAARLGRHNLRASRQTWTQVVVAVRLFAVRGHSEGIAAPVLPH